MKRPARRFAAQFANLSLFCAFLPLFLCVFESAAQAQAEGSKPNIVFVLCDDLGYGDVGVFFQDLRKANNDRSEPWHFTPNLDTFAAQGIQLRGHYCPSPVCAPSRGSLLCGVHQGHAGVRDNQFDKALENNHTLATVLSTAGYATAAIGKWGLQGSGSSPADWPAYPTKRGFGYYFGYVRHDDGHEHYPKEGPWQGAKQIWDGTTEISSQLDKCYTADLFTARAKKWIVDQHSANPAQPFFLYLAYDTPHATIELPTGPYPAGGGLTGGLQWTGTPGAMINTAIGTVDSWIHPDYASATYDADKNPASAEVPWPNVYQRYATCIRRLDDCLGDLVKLLQDLGIDNNTLVIFTSDNGPSNESYLPQANNPNFFNSFGPFDGIKRDCWEGGIRVGALARWPGIIPPNQISNEPSQFHDWMPTFATLAGVPPPARTDGVSLLPTLTGMGTQELSTIYVEYYYDGTTPSYADFLPAHRGRTRAQMQAIRIGDMLGVRYNVQSHADNFEIYNIASDPQEGTDLASANPELQKQMKDTVIQLRRPDSSAPRPYDAELMPSANPSPVTGGVQWAAYTQAFPWVAKLDELTPASNGISASPDLTVRPREQNFGVLYTGYLSVPSDSDYTFYLTADSGALLRIHGATVIDADYGYTGGTERSGTVKLTAGKHPFRLYYTHGASGTPALSLQWSSTTISKQAIPSSTYFRDGTGSYQPPVATDDQSSTSQATAITIDALANDTGGTAQQALTLLSVTQPGAGSAIISNGKIVSTPRSDFLGRDSFNYEIGDGINTAVGTVTVDVCYRDGDYWYPLNQSSGLSTEEAGGGLFATLHGFTGDTVQWVGGRTGYALQFDGAANYVTIDSFNGFTGTDARSITAWVRTTATGTATAGFPIVAWGPNSSGNKWTFLMNGTGQIRLEVTGGWVVGAHAVNDGQWHHVACVFPNDGTPNVTDVKLYVDGLLETISSSSALAINTTSSTAVKIGSDIQSRFWKGTMQDVRIFHRALTAVEVSAEASEASTRADAWQRRHFGATPASWMGDADGDGMTNLEEYAFGGQPGIASRAIYPQVSTGAQGSQIIFRRRPSSSSELTYTVQASTDLMAWNLPVNLLTTAPVTVAGDSFEQVNFAVPNQATYSRLFYRVVVQLP